MSETEIEFNKLKDFINSKKGDFFISADLGGLMPHENVTESVTDVERSVQNGRD